MNVSSNEVIVSEKPMRITRIVSVILNGVVLEQLAVKSGHNVDIMTDTLMSNLSGRMQKAILSNEMPLVDHSLRQEIKRRINLPRAI